jgi:ABC-2 type transport system ATP-binding protein
MNEPTIVIEQLHFSYGRREILHGMDLQVPRGSIFGFLGRNGAGKTTTIKALLGLHAPAGGRCSILEVDPAIDPLRVRQIVGYMAEDQQMYGWMRIDEIVKWVASFYPNWDFGFSDKLISILDLPRRQKIKTLSKGQNSRLALVLSLGHHPAVVILDDPTLGLDPISRKEFLRNVISLLQTSGVTVFFSSHLLYEIEPVADQLAILDGGKIIKSGSTESFRESVRRFILPEMKLALDGLPNVLDVSRTTESVCLTVDHCTDEIRGRIAKLTGGGFREESLNLDEIFEACIIGNRGDESKRNLFAAVSFEEVINHA